MRSLTTLTLTMAVVTLVPTGIASAQDREGFFVGFGVGYGSAKIDCDGCGDATREGSITAHVRVGTSLSERLLVGAELNGWFDSEEGDSASLFNATAALYLYPSDAGLFVKGGVGLSRADFDIEGDTISGLGLGVMAGLGYDIRVGSNTSVTPMATFWYGKPGDLEFDGIPVLTGFSHNVIEVGVGVTFH